MQTRRSLRAHQRVLPAIAALAAPSVAMLPAIALEGVAAGSHSASVVVPIPQEHVDVIARPKLRPKAKPRRVVARKRNVPHAKKPRSTPALRVGFSWPVT